MVIVFGALIPGSTNAAKGAAVGLFTYIAFFGATWLPLPWLYPAEVNPVKTRGKANAVSTCTNWLFNFVVVMITPVMIDNIGVFDSGMQQKAAANRIQAGVHTSSSPWSTHASFRSFTSTTRKRRDGHSRRLT